MRNCTYEIGNLISFPSIEGSYLTGYPEYLEDASFQRIRVVFPIIPQYRIASRDEKSTPYLARMDLSP
jgi:hypothetical protein